MTEMLLAMKQVNYTTLDSIINGDLVAEFGVPSVDVNGVSKFTYEREMVVLSDPLKVFEFSYLDVAHTDTSGFGDIESKILFKKMLIFV